MTRKVRVPAGTPVRAPYPQTISDAGDTKTGDTTQDSTTVTNLASDVNPAGWRPGMAITGNGLAPNTLIAAIDNNGRSLTLSNPATASGNTPLTVYPLAEWSPLGPATTGGGAAKGSPRISGRVRALAVSDDGRRIYAGTASGGLWYSEDGGGSWKPLDLYRSARDAAGNLHYADALSVGALAVRWGEDPANPGTPDPSRDVVYVGAGEQPVLGLLTGNGTDTLAMGKGIRVATGPAGAGGPEAVGWILEAEALEGMVVHRLALDRVTDGVVWAATALGLYRRDPGGGAVNWHKQDTGLGDGEIADVLVTGGRTGEQQRVYAASMDGRLARSVDGGAWQAIDLPAYPTRVTDAAPIPPGSVRQDRAVQRVRLAGTSSAGSVVVFVLAEGPRLWRLENDAAAPVAGLPEDIFDGGMDATPSGLCLAVHPLGDAAHQNWIAVGGHSFTGPDGRRQAALFRGQLTQDGGGNWSLPAEAWAGEGIPPGLHALSWTPGAAANGGNPAVGPQLWVAGETGVYQSAEDGLPGTFRSRSTGLPAVECLALAQAPDGHVMLLSTRQGVLERVSGETWRLSLAGRTGGVAIDPTAPYRAYAQRPGTGWMVQDLVKDRTETDPARRGWQPLNVFAGPPSTVSPGSAADTTWQNALKAERDLMSATSRPALIDSATCVRGTQIAMGSNRVWYTDGAVAAARLGSSAGWVTLPTASDPFGGAQPNLTQDVLDGPIRMLHWAGPQVLYALTRTGLYRFERQVTLQTGNTHTNATLDGLSTNVWEAGWLPGLPISGNGIPVNTIISAIATDGRSLTLSQEATAANNNVQLTVPVCGDTRTGDLVAGNTLVSNISSDVAAAGWRAGMPIRGPQIPMDATIVSVEAGGRSVRISHAPASAAAGAILTVPAASTWTQTRIYDQSQVRNNLKFKIFGGSIPPDLELTCVAPHDLARGTGSLYVGTAGDPSDEHLWWYDGTGAWRDTGLRGALADSPMYAVTVDPADPNRVYVGTEHGVWQGRGDFPASGAPRWTWTYFSVGLPEAACVDLAITTSTDSMHRVLRAALAGLGVWEVSLNLAQPKHVEIYLRADDFDARRQPIPDGGARDPRSAQGRQARLDASPDLRVLRRTAQQRVDNRTGDTHSNTTLDGLAPDVRLAGWRIGAPVSGAGIPPGTRISGIANDGLSVTLSQAATATASGVTVSVPVLGSTQPGNIQQNSLTVQNLPVDVRTQGWQVGMQVVGDCIPPLTTITAISSNGRSVTLSLPAQDTRAGTALTALPCVPGTHKLPDGTTTDRFDIWLLQSALMVEGADLLPDDLWSGAVRTALDARRAALGMTVRPAGINAAALAAAAEWDERLWEGVLLGNRLPFTQSVPDYADLVLKAWDEPDRWPKGRPASVASDGLSTVYVTVHGRASAAANSVRVVLLKTKYGGSADLSNITPLPAGWSASLTNDLIVRTGNWLPAGWSYADPANPDRPVTAALGPRSPQVVSFDVDLTLGNASPAGDFDTPGWLLLAVVVAVDDPLTETATDVAELVRTSRHVAARSVRAARLLNQTGSHRRYAGVDMYAYPGADEIKSIWALSNIFWTGFWFSRLNNPAAENPTVVYPGAQMANYTDPPFTSGMFISPGGPNLTPYRGHLDASWTTRLGEITPFLGYVPLYFGHQDPRNGDMENAGYRPKGPFDLRSLIGIWNAEDAVAQAMNASIPLGAVLYLDWEYRDFNWELRTQAGNNLIASSREYCEAFFRRLTELGYRPGVYTPRNPTQALRDSCPGLFIWHVSVPNNVPNPLIRQPAANGVKRLDFDRSTPNVDQHTYTIARQWRLDYTLPANPTGLQVGVDLNVSTVTDPAYPERHVFPGLLTGGKGAALYQADGSCAVYAIRAGEPKRVTWPIVGPVIPETCSPDTTYGWNPFTPLAALTLPGEAGEILLGMGYQQAEGEDVWRVQLLRRLGRDRYLHQTVPSSGVRLDPLPGVAVCSRSGGTLDIFAVDDITGRLAMAHYSPQKGWAPLSLLSDVAGIPATLPVSRTNRITAVSRDTGVIDVFWTQPVQAARLTVTAATNASPIQITTSTPHQLANDAPVIIHGVGRNTAANGAYNVTVVNPTQFTLNGSTGNGNYNGGGTVTVIDQKIYTNTSFGDRPTVWSAMVQLGPPGVRVHPMANLVALSARSDRMDVLFIGRADGTTAWSLYDYYWEAADSWGNPPHSVSLNIVGPPFVAVDPLVSIAACITNPTRIDVFVAGVDGSLYTTSFNPTGVPVFTPFRQEGGAPPSRIAAIESAISQDLTHRAVFVTGSDDQLYIASTTSPNIPANREYSDFALVGV